MLTYCIDAGVITPAQIEGFFVGWPTPPSPEQLVDVMDGSFRRVWALDGTHVVGYVNAISDGHLAAFIPWLEVHPDYQGRGIGTELVTRLLAQLDGMYSIDLACDAEVAGFYEKFDFFRATAMVKRNPRVLGA